MPEMAASGLWTTPSDYARILVALIAAWRGGDKAFLSPALARDMMTEVGPSRVGLGPFLDGYGTSRRFSHSGANDSYRSEEHTSELQSLMRISYAVFCLKKKKI